MNQLINGTIKMDDWAVSIVGQFLKKSSSAQEPELQRGGIGELLMQLTADKYIVMVVFIPSDIVILILSILHVFCKPVMLLSTI